MDSTSPAVCGAEGIPAAARRRIITAAARIYAHDGDGHDVLSTRQLELIAAYGPLAATATDQALAAIDPTTMHGLLTTAAELADHHTGHLAPDEITTYRHLLDYDDEDEDEGDEE